MFRRSGADGRRLCEGWYQTCGGDVASIDSKDWDVIEKPEGDEPVVTRPVEEAGPARFTLWMETRGGMGNQILQLLGLLALAEAINSMHPLARVSVGLSERHAAVPSSQRYETYDTVMNAFKSWLAPWPGSPFDCECIFEEGVTTREPFARSWDFPDAALQPWGEDWAAALARELVGRFHNCSYVKVSGYFQDRRYYESMLPRLVGFLWHVPSAQRAMAELAKLGLGGLSLDLAISVHYRLGDVAGAWEVRGSYFERAVREARKRLGGRNLTCVIFSDTPDLAWNRSRSLTSCQQRVPAPEIDPGISFYTMAQIPNGVLSLSTFSYTAALVGRKKVVIAPDVKFGMFNYLKQHEWVTLKTSMKGCHKDC